MADTSDLKKYELMLIFSGEMPETEFKKALDEVKRLLQEHTKGISHEDHWGRRDFAYRMKRQRAGYYSIFNFSAEAPALVELRNNMKINPHILRYMLVVMPEDYDPSKYKLEEIIKKPVEKEEAKARPRKKLVPQELERVPSAAAIIAAEAPPAQKPTIAGKEEEEQLKTVEKKLEEILENPDIELK